MIYINTEKKVIKSWCNEPEEEALEQAKNLANLPFLFKHVALMPDVHLGYGMPIGGVIATEGMIIPNAVGVDIGCGMCAVKTNVLNESMERNKLLSILGDSSKHREGIKNRIPTGFTHQKKKQEWKGFINAPKIKIIQKNIESAKKQLGTLGGGNHFIEIQKGDDAYIWIMIHSGSRNIGYQIAKYYNNLAKSLRANWHSSVPPFKGEDELAFLPIDTEYGKQYIDAMNFALEFALENRLRMMDVCKEEFKRVFPNVEFNPVINVHHNYARMEKHFGKDVVVHRKGATSAKKGEVGIIPGSQGEPSYIVEGLGNEKSFNSCSHGAGRKMSRNQARKEINLKKEIKMLNDKNILHSIRGTKDLDEAPSAYKNIDVVMEEQKDLVKIITKLNPLAVIKG